MELDATPGKGLQPTPAEPAALSGPRSVLVVVLYILGQLVGGAIAIVPFILIAGEEEATDPPDMVLLLSAVVGILFGALLAFLVTRDSLRPLPLREAMARVGVVRVPARKILGPLAAGGALSLMLIAILVAVFPEPSESSLGPVAQLANSKGPAAVILALIAIFVAPPIEEFVFRGVLFTGSMATWGPRISVLLVTGLFAALHLFETYAFLPALIPITMMALIAYRLRARTGSILPGLGLHVGYNFGLFALLLVQALVT